MKRIKTHGWKSEQLQSFAKPNSIKLNPFTKLPRLKTNSSTPTEAFAKGKTQQSQEQMSRHGRRKTQGQYSQEQSASFRVISRFIYNHLQKKINFNAHIIRNYPNLSIDVTPNLPINRQKPSPLLSSKADSCSTYSYEKYHPLRESNHTLLLKFKNKYMRNKAINRSGIKEQQTHQKNRNKSRYANIDSYFDLTCLQDKLG